MGRNCTPFRSHSIRRSTHDEPCRPTRFFFSFSPLKHTHTQQNPTRGEKEQQPTPLLFAPFHLFDVSRNLIAPPAVVIIYKKIFIY
jgi:hypothetical protein